MAIQLGPIEIRCDAPPYAIVRACGEVGIQSPEDVAWHRLPNYLSAQKPLPSLFQVETWRIFLGMDADGQPRCRCGEPLPALERYTFLLSNGNQFHYLLGQCSRCRSVYWDQEESFGANF